MEQDVTPVTGRIDARVVQIRNKDHLPSELVELLGEVARMQAEAEPEAKVVLPEKTAPDDEVILGRSLVERENMPYDAAQAEQLFSRFIERLKDEVGPLGEAVKTIANAVEAEEIRPAQLFEKVLRDELDVFEAWSKKTPKAPHALYFLAFSALTPSLRAGAKQLAEKLPEVKNWRAGTCPICGSLPLIAELRGKEGERWATCSFCHHEYRVRRLACMVCGEAELPKLNFFTVPEESGFRVETCASCKCYVKTIDFREHDRASLPEFDDLDSLTLDFVAAREGYKRATLSAWGF